MKTIETLTKYSEIPTIKDFRRKIDDNTYLKSVVYQKGKKFHILLYKLIKFQDIENIFETSYKTLKSAIKNAKKLLRYYGKAYFEIKNEMVIMKDIFSNKEITHEFYTSKDLYFIFVNRYNKDKDKMQYFLNHFVI